jgi:hypothetical protein
MCRGSGSHGSIYRQDALHFDPILVYQMPDGTHYYPGHNADPAPVPEAKPIWLNTLRRADAFVRETNQREQLVMDRRTEARRNQIDCQQKESRAQLRSALERRGISRANVEAIIADRDGRGPSKEVVMRQFEDVARASGQPFNREHVERIYERTQQTRRNPEYRTRPESRFTIDVFANDSSNRMGYRDERTGWRMKKS